MSLLQLMKEKYAQETSRRESETLRVISSVVENMYSDDEVVDEIRAAAERCSWFALFPVKGLTGRYDSSLAYDLRSHINYTLQGEFNVIVSASRDTCTGLAKYYIEVSGWAV